MVHKEVFPVTHLRQRMLGELQRRNYSPNTVRSYIHGSEFARYFCRSAEQWGPEHVCEYQVHLFRDRKLSPRAIEGQAAALRFLLVKTLRRSYLPNVIALLKHRVLEVGGLVQDSERRATYLASSMVTLTKTGTLNASIPKSILPIGIM